MGREENWGKRLDNAEVRAECSLMRVLGRAVG